MTSIIDDDALQQLEDAANTGDTSLQFLLGQMYEGGLGVTQNLSKATVWYRKAVSNGDESSQINLGWMYADGRGVIKDEEEAKKLWSMAASQRNERAQSYLRRAHEPISVSDLHEFVRGSTLNTIKDEISAWALGRVRFVVGLLAIAALLGMGGGGLYIVDNITTRLETNIKELIESETKKLGEMVIDAQKTLGRMREMAEIAEASVEATQHSEMELKKSLDRRRATQETKSSQAVPDRKNVE